MILSWSGGKDSAVALWTLQRNATLRVHGLLTTVTQSYDRISMHGIRRSILHAQATHLELPVVEASIAAGASNDDYERAFSDGLERARTATHSERVIAYGDLFLEDVREYREQLL